MLLKNLIHRSFSRIKIFKVIGILFFLVKITAFAQTPEPQPKQTLLDLNTTASSFSGHFWDLYAQQETPEFATWLGIPQKEIQKRRIRKISFKGEGNAIYRPNEVGDAGGHDNAFLREWQVEVRVDTLPPEPDNYYAFDYEFNREGRLVAANFPAAKNGESMHVRRWYYPDGKLRESRYISYDLDRDRRDTLVRNYSGFVLTYDAAGRKTEKLSYHQEVESHYRFSRERKPGQSDYYFETRKLMSQTKFMYHPKGQLAAIRVYQLPDSGKAGSKSLESASFYFYDKPGKLQRVLAITRMERPVKDYAANGSMSEFLYSYKGEHLQRVISREFSFSSAVPDTIMAAKGEIGADSSSLGSQYYTLVHSENNPGPHPYIKPFGGPDTVYYLQPGETRSHLRNYYSRQDKAGRTDLAYAHGVGFQKRRYGKRLLETWSNNDEGGYKCRFIWLNRKKQPEREIWIDRYNSGREKRYHFCENYPSKDCNTLEDLVMHKRITVTDQRYQYRKDGLPEKVTLRTSFNREALRKVGEKNPRRAWAELLLKPCKPCEPCENVKQLVKEEPEWPFRNSAARVFTGFRYEFY